jgi:hypothetical protein
MIGRAVQSGKSVKVYNEKNKLICSKSGTLQSYTSSMVSINKGNSTYVYNDKCKLISTKSS